MFDEFNVHQFYLTKQAALSMYAAGRTTGVILDSGDGASHIVPLFDGHLISDEVLNIPLAGRDLT